MNKSVLKKLFSEKEQSVELSEVQKLELASLQDIEKTIQEGVKFSQVGFDAEKKALGFLVDAVDGNKMSVARYNAALNIANDVLNKIREIGLDDKQILDKVTLIKKYISDANKNIKRLEPVMKSL